MKRIRRTHVVPGQEKASDHWRTPPALFEFLDQEFRFEIDLAADESNTLVHQRWLGPGGEAADALAVDWVDHALVGFLNPPYSSALIKRFMEHVVKQAMDGFTTVTLTPCDLSTKWWRWMRYAAEIREIPHRVPYLKADGVTKTGAMFSSVVAVFRPQPGVRRGQPRRVTWSWKPHETKAKR